MHRSWIAFALITAASAPALADDPTFAYGKKEDVVAKDGAKPEWTATAEAGLVFTTGNSETTTGTGGFKASRKAGSNKVSLEGSITYAKSGLRALVDKNGNGMIDSKQEITTVDTLTAETLASKARYDRFLTEFNSLFAAVLASRDLPAGKESVFGGQLGYSRQLYKTKLAEAVGEFGYDFSREDLVVGPAVSIHSARAFVGYKATMTEGTSLDASLELLTNLNKEKLATTNDDGTPVDGSAFKDTRVNGKLAVSAKVNKSLAVQTSVEGKFDNRPGPLTVKGAVFAPGFVPAATTLDTIMKASLIYTF